MRVLSFPAKSTEYSILFQATLSAEMKLQPKEYQTLADIQIRLEDAGEPVAKKETEDSIVLHKCPKAATVTFEEEEFALLRRCMEATAFLPAVSRHVASTYKMLDEAKAEKPKVIK